MGEGDVWHSCRTSSDQPLYEHDTDEVSTYNYSHYKNVQTVT